MAWTKDSAYYRERCCAHLTGLVYFARREEGYDELRTLLKHSVICRAVDALPV